jgi:predicted GTPase
MEANVQCWRILEGIERLEAYLQEQVAKEALDLDSNYDTTKNQEMLLRLKRSLLQYTERGKSLTYVGFMGHFSAGKSSTINSLLSLDEASEEARRVGLNPVDKAITLITHSENKESIFTSTKEDLVSIRATFIDSDFLKNIVIADTPGTGDPVLASAIAQDFLPICDLIVYLFSAAIPLDSADVPLLREKNSNLAFIPIQFVVTRADEFKKNLGSQFGEENFDSVKASSFLSELSQRINHLFSGSHYIDPNSILLINNKPHFQLEQLSKVILEYSNSSNFSSQINIHSHKIIYFQSSADNLKQFFCKFLLDKLHVLSEVIKVSQENIERFKGRIRLTNNELTESWNRMVNFIREKRNSSFEQLENLTEMPSSIGSLCSKTFRGFDSATYWKSEVDQQVQLIKVDIKRNILHQARDRVSTVRSNVNNLKSLGELNQLDNLKLDFGAYQEGQLFNKVDFLPSALVSDQSLLIIRKVEASLAEYHREIKRAVESLKRLLVEQKPVKEYQSVLSSAINNLLRDFDNSFDSITVYRSGVFALNVKEAISKLGLGYQMDVLESRELTELQKEEIKQKAKEHIFPDSHQAFSAYLAELSDLALSLDSLQKKVNSQSLGVSATSNPLLENWKTSQLGLIKSDLTHSITSSIDRLQHDTNNKIEEIVFKFSREWEDEVTRMRSERRNRLIILTVSFGIGGVLLYLIYLFGANKFLSNNYFVTLVSGVAVNLISNLVGFVWAKVTDKFPINIKAKESSILSDIRDEYGKSVDHALESFDDLIRIDNQVIYDFWKELLVTKPLNLWSVSNENNYQELSKFADEYLSLSAKYRVITNSATETATNYFYNTNKNLEKLNEFLDELQQTAIEPSFELLAETQRRLDTVIQNIQAIDFK